MATLFSNTLSAFIKGNIFLNTSFGLRFCSNLIHHHSPRPPSIYQKVSKLEDALNLFDEMSQRTPLPSVVYFTQLLNSVTKMNHFSHSIHLFKRMCEIGLPVDHYTTNIAIKCCCHLHRTKDGMRNSKLNSDVVYTTLIDGASKYQKFDVARALFHDLMMKGLEPDVRTYTVMINCLCREGLLGDAKKLFLKMDESGCSPDDVTYRVLLQGYLKNHQYVDVEMLLQEMYGRGYSLDVSTLSLLIDSIAAGSLGLFTNENWGFNTNFQRVFDRMLEVAVNGKLSEDEMVKRVLVFSDMEFDQASECGSWIPWETDYYVIQRKFKSCGYEKVPEIVFWNLRDSRSTLVTANQEGVAVLSGFSKNLLTLFLEEGGVINPEDLSVKIRNPESIMEAAISGELYQKVVIYD